MSKPTYLLLVSLILISSLSFIQSSPTYTQLYTDPYLNLPPQQFYQGTYYTGSAAYNPITNTITNIGSVGNCTGGLRVTTNFQFWCLGQTNGTYSLDQINPGLTKIVASYPITSIGSTSVDYIYASGTFLILAKLNQQSGATSVSFFNTISREYECTTALINPYFNLGTQWYTGYGFLYTTFNSQRELTLTFAPCVADQPFSANVGKVYSQFNFVSLNYSTVFLRYYNEFANNVATYYVQPFFSDIENNLILGSVYKLYEVSAVSNTTLFGTSSTNGFFTFGFYVINAQLELVNIGQYISPVNTSTLRANAIYGTSQVVVDIGSGQMIYDFSKNQIVNATGMTIPILFSNGSVVNITRYGYFIQSPGQPIYFNYVPNQHYYQSLTDPTQFWTLFIPSASGYYYKTCTLLQIRGSANIIQSYTFNQCPIGSGYPVIEDVFIDTNGMVHVAYTDGDQNLYILTQISVVGPFNTLQGLISHKLSLSTTSPIGYFVALPVLGQATNLNVTVFSTTTGAIISSNLLVGNYYAISKLTGQYFLAAIVNGTAINFVTINATSGTQINSNRAAIQTAPGGTFFMVPMGISSGTTPSYNGIALLLQGINVYLVGADGTTSSVSFSGTFQRSIQPATTNSFFVRENQYLVTYQTLYQITGWTEPEVKRNDKFLGEYLY